MTREEIINVVKNIRNYMVSGNPIWDRATVNEAMNTAIEALERTPNAFPTHECVEPTHECIEKQVTGKLISVGIPTKREPEEEEKQVKGELISREDALDVPDTNVGKSEPLEWIPCSERLPEKEGWYITTVESEKTGKRRIENDLFAVDIALAHGHTPNKFCKDGYKQRTVAWTPFPEPWKGEQNE